MPHSLPGRCWGIDKAPPPSLNFSISFSYPSSKYCHVNTSTQRSSSAEHLYCFILLVLHLTSGMRQDIIKTSSSSSSTGAYHHDHTINGMFIAFTSSPFLDNHLTLVMSWSYQVPVIFTSIKASRVPPWQCRSIFQPTWTLTKLKQQASLTQGMSAPHRYHANILY